MFVRALHMIIMGSQGREPQIEGFEMDGHILVSLLLLTSWGMLSGGKMRGSLMINWQ